MDIYSRFKALPRGRKGSTTVVIVEEEVLESLLIDAQASEARSMAGSATHWPSGDNRVLPGVDPAASPPATSPSTAVLVEGSRLARPSRSSRRRGGW